MSVGEKIRFYRRKCGMTQKALGTAVGFPESSADVRIAQYESGTRSPKLGVMKALSGVLGVSPETLRAPDADDVGALMQALFVLEDAYDASVRADGEDVVLRIPCGAAGAADTSAASTAPSANVPAADEQAKDAGHVGAVALRQALLDWACRADGLASGEASRDGYDEWRHSFPS